MSYLKNFDIGRFLIIVATTTALTFFSFLSAFGKDEGTLLDNFLLNFIADSFYIFLFPTHILFGRFMTNDIWAFLGFFVNAIFYALIIEGIICILKGRSKGDSSYQSRIE
jgi:hypothetical protein